MDINKLIANIAKNLKNLRKEKGLSQEQLVSLIGEEKISLRSYKSYENEKSRRLPLLDKLLILSEFYNCPIDNIIYNRLCFYSDSFSKKDCLHRLVDLIASLVLVPEKETDKDCKFYGKYCFYAFDSDTSLFLDKLLHITRENNFNFEYLGKIDLNIIDRYHQIINDLPNVNEDWSLSENRLRVIALEGGLDYDEYKKQKIENIQTKREIQELKQPK